MLLLNLLKLAGIFNGLFYLLGIWFLVKKAKKLDLNKNQLCDFSKWKTTAGWYQKLFASYALLEIIFILQLSFKLNLIVYPIVEFFLLSSLAAAFIAAFITLERSEKIHTFLIGVCFLNA